MGYNPYNHMKSTGFRWQFNETVLLAQAAAIKRLGLQGLGYEYMKRDPSTGRPVPDPAKFPGIASGRLARELHEMGFRFGTTVTRAPRTAAAAAPARSGTRRWTRRSLPSGGWTT